MIQVNLLPESVLDARKAARLKRTTRFLFIFYMAVLGGIVVLTFLYQGVQLFRLTSARDAHEVLDAEVNSQENVDFRTEVKAVQGAIAEFSSSTSEEQFSAETMLTDLEKVAPDTISFETVTSSEDGLINIEGKGSGFSSIADMIQKIKSIEITEVVEAENEEEATITKTRRPFEGASVIGINSSGEGLTAFSIRTTYIQFAGLEIDTGVEESE